MRVAGVEVSRPPDASRRRRPGARALPGTAPAAAAVSVRRGQSSREDRAGHLACRRRPGSLTPAARRSSMVLAARSRRRRRSTAPAAEVCRSEGAAFAVVQAPDVPSRPAGRRRVPCSWSVEPEPILVGAQGLRALHGLAQPDQRVAARARIVHAADSMQRVLWSAGRADGSTPRRCRWSISKLSAGRR